MSARVGRRNGGLLRRPFCYLGIGKDFYFKNYILNRRKANTYNCLV